MAPTLWTPSPERITASNLKAFAAGAGEEWGIALPDYAAVYDWSIGAPDQFWASLWRHLGIKASEPFANVFEPANHMKDFTWFPGARLNHAENLLRRRDGAPALIHWRDGERLAVVSFEDLYARVSRLAQALANAGVGDGDRVVGILPNAPDAVVAMLAANSLGAIWSLCSPDFGVRGVLERFRQIEPKVLFAAGGHVYKGAWHPAGDKLRDIQAGLPSLERIVFVADGGGGQAEPTAPDLPGVVPLDDFIAPFTAGEIEFVQRPFDHPSFILFTSGTTGPPKCIVHGAGGLLIQLLKEHRLQYDVKPGDRYFYFTTTGWNMWYWLTTALAAGAAVVLYDGSPFHPHPGALFDMADAEGVTQFGTSPKYIDTLRQRRASPRTTHDLGALRTVLSTGSPLSEDGFDYVYGHIKKDVCLSSVSGGTDIMATFASGDPTGPVRRGELQVRALGMKAEIFNDSGRSIVGKKGELVCTQSFPSQPAGFWNDPGDQRYRATYYERFPGVWHHGDFAELTGSGGMVIHGRSDATLNPGGVRIGTAEIYRAVDSLDQVEESLAIGQDWQGDVRIVLFVCLSDGHALDDVLIGAIKDRVREATTPRHVPAKVVQVSELPRTRTGKLAEIAVKRVVDGDAPPNTGALANPDALSQFSDRPELSS